MNNQTSEKSRIKFPIVFVLGTSIIVGLSLLQILLFEYNWLFFAIGTCVFILGPFILARIDFDREHLGKRWFIILNTGWIIISLFLLLVTIPGILGGRRSAWENRCMLTLRALGSTQLAFDKEFGNGYGTWEELQAEDFIQDGHTKDNIIDVYRIVTFDAEKRQFDEAGNMVKDSSFTIVAAHFDDRDYIYKTSYMIIYATHYEPPYRVIFYNESDFSPRPLSISEDQLLRGWIGDDSQFNPEDIHLRDLSQWEPLR